MTNKQPLVSILIPSYNYAPYLPEAIESALAQTYTNFELIIIDNCSTDNTVDVVTSYTNKDPRVKLHINDSNIGMYPNFNKALSLAQGEYIKFLNADDKFHEALLSDFVHIFQTQPSVSLVTSSRMYFGKKSDTLKPPFTGLISGTKAILHSLKTSNWIGEPTTVMFKRENLINGSFDTSLLMFADLDMWLKQCQMGDVYIIDKVLSYFRQHDDQGTEHLNSNLDKKVFSFLQLHEYKRFALQSNKFNINYFQDYPKESKEILFNLEKTSMSYFKYAFGQNQYSKNIRSMLGCYALKYILSIPKFNIYRFKRSINKRLKKS